ncbi:hypothetical protein [Rhizobium esperanzae]|uniref:Flagellar FliJ protein n=1 Tax=Rhizobium esperanzae TaxID=1967781 RepID=A0A7W6R2R2_9HYPH|nr:hypothetical protein [Rhizobium esperanzae]MBB4235759.1 hypothetical protein [Rhizobium esperanzae]
MKALRSLRQLLEIRNLRADSLSRGLSEARADAERASEEEARATAARDIAANRAAGDPIIEELCKDGIILASRLQDAVMRQSLLRGHEADAGALLEKRKLARLAAQERAERAAGEFTEAQKAVLRIEIHLNRRKCWREASRPGRIL